MARYEFKLPDIGEGVTEGEIVNWLVAVGDTVTEDQEMVEVMTDKATVTIGSPRSARIAELRGAVGDIVPVGHVLVVFESSGKAEAEAPAAEAPAAEADAEKKEEPAATAVGDIKESLPGMAAAAAPKKAAPAPAAAAPADDYFNEKPLAAPATRKLARELGVDLKRVRPSGPGGRVTREDVQAHHAGGGAAPAPAAPAPAAATPKAAPAAPAQPIAVAPVQAAGGEALEERIPLRGMRRRIFENMARSKHTAAHFTYVDECETTALREVRTRLKPYAEEQGVRLHYLPFIVKACVAALKKHPALNCVFDESTNEMVLRKNYDIGIAAATEAGLVVPVLRNADRLSVLEIAEEINRLGDAAREGKLRQEDFGGSSFTITSLGRQGGLFATPIVNYPEVAILGVHEMKKKPVVKDDQIVIGEVMLLSLSFDHRIIDGHMGAAFAADIIALLESPEKLTLHI